MSPTVSVRISSKLILRPYYWDIAESGQDQRAPIDIYIASLDIAAVGSKGSHAVENDKGSQYEYGHVRFATDVSTGVNISRACCPY